MSIISPEDTTHTRKISKTRIAVMGMAKSGKSMFLHNVESELLQKNGDAFTRFNMSMNDLYEDSHHVLTVRHALHKENMKKTKKLHEILRQNMDADVLLVDDVLFDWECDVLQQYGFTIVYVTSPWHSRFSRVTSKDLIWMCSQEEISLMKNSNFLKKKFNMVEYLEEHHDLSTFIQNLCRNNY